MTDQAISRALRQLVRERKRFQFETKLGTRANAGKLAPLPHRTQRLLSPMLDV